MTDDADTLPPPPDPEMAIWERVEQKLDALDGVARACFDELQEQRIALAELRGRVEALERVPPRQNGSAPP